MAEKTLKTKIALLYKTYAEWTAKADYVPLKGEVCICEVPTSTGVVTTEPAVLLKVGNGTTKFEDLPWTSALAADVYAWAKKENLSFSDLDATFLAALDERIAAKSENVEYQLVNTENNVFKLQKREIGATDWTDVSSIDVGALLNKKVDKEIEGTNGKAIIFNEADGGGAKFEHNDGLESFVGVNDGGKDGLAAQIYADMPQADGTWKGAKLDVTNGGMYYTVGNLSRAERDVAANELAVKGDIKEYSIVKDSDPGDYAAIYHLTKNGVNVGEAINIAKDQLLKSVEVKVCTEKDKPITGLNVGDKYIDFTFDTTEGEKHSYIAVKDMVQPYTAGDGITISDANVISVDSIEIAKVNGLQDALDAKATVANLDAEVTRAKAAEAGKLDLMPGDEMSGGNAYNLPYYFKTDVGTDKVTVHALTVTLDGKKTYGDYTLDVDAATEEKAGLLTAADKTNLDKAVLEDDTLILNCNLD